MLYLIPKPAHRIALRVAHRIRLRWWRISKPRLAGCRVLAIDPDGRVLLVRHAYGSGKWMAPGGGLGRREDPVAAGQRELREETGCTLQSALLLDLVEERFGGVINQVHIVCGTTQDRPLADGREIVEACFFRLDDLPDAMSPQFRERLPEWIKAATAARRRHADQSP